MSGLFTLIFLCSVPAFVMGLIFPRLVMPWDKQATRKKSAKLYLAAIISSFVLFGMTAPPSSRSKSNQSTTTGKTPNTAFQKIGDTVQASDRAIRVDLVEGSQGLQIKNMFAQPIDGSIILIYATFTNSGNEQGDFFWSDFQMSDAQGRKYSEIEDSSYSIWRSEQGFKDRGADYFPGESRKEVIAFRVAPDATGLQLQWKSNRVDLDR